MPYDPKKHNRQSIRLPHYDYSQPGSYFITSCCQHMICRFGKIVTATPVPGQHASLSPAPTMQLNELGQIAYNEWLKLPERFSNVELGVFQIMPNHMHGIITLVAADIRSGASPAPTESKITNAAPTIGDMVGSYKSLVSNACLDIFKARNEHMGKLWQRNLYEHIIRDKKSYDNISNYIINNPSTWNDDKFYNE